MSLIPMLFSDWWEDLDRPHHIFDQHFGLSLNPDTLATSISALSPYESNFFNHLRYRPRRQFQRYQPYSKKLTQNTSGASTVAAKKDKFQVTLDVQQFSPEEVTVKVNGKNVIVEGKHEEKRDEHGWISRQFVRKYLVPEQCNLDEIKSTLSSDGVLTISVPRKEIEQPKKKERIIQIENTGQPALHDNFMTKSVESSNEKNDQTQKSQMQQRGQEQSVKAA